MVFRILCIIGACAVPSHAAVIPVEDIAAVSVQTSQLKLNTLHAQFMKTQMVKDAIVLKDNFLQTKAYYNYVYERSQHRGGLMGYYKDFFEEQFKNMAADEWRRLNHERSTISSGTMINRLVADASNGVNGKVRTGIGFAGDGVSAGLRTLDGGYSNVRGEIFTKEQQLVAAMKNFSTTSEQRGDAMNKQIQDLVRRGSASAISEKELESIALQASLLQLQLLSETRQLLNFQAQQFTAQTEKNLTEFALALKASNDLAKYSLGAPKPKKTPAEQEAAIIHEMKRIPGEK